jgi:2-haloacid dehalogenase
MTGGPAEVQALAFDVFGTVVDWRGSLIRELDALAGERGLKGVDWAAFADAWRGAYQPSMQEVREGRLPWTRLDDLHRRSLERLLGQFGVEGLGEAEMRRINTIWHRLRPWPDAIAGLTRLRRRYILATLSNGNVALLTNMARHAGLPWDCILSAELCRHYKPDPEVYRMVCDLLDLAPQQVMMVAAHNDDLRHAARQGLRTAFVRRPQEHGPGQTRDLEPEAPFDVVADDFGDLADILLREGSP